MSDITGYNSISIVGLGLIGGSIALKLKEVLPECKITAFDLDHESLEMAKRNGIIDEIGSFSDHSFNEKQIIIIATHLDGYANIASKLKNINKEIIITDIGSVKQYPIEIFREFGLEEQFVPAHPIAGKEISGFKSATNNLFDNKKVIITPTLKTDNGKVKEIEKLWKKLGAIPTTMNADAHDRNLAFFSHLPQALIFCESNIIEPDLNNLALKQHLRLASSNRKMWDQIFKANKEALNPILEYVISLFSKIDHEYILKAKEEREKLETNPIIPVGEIQSISYFIAAILVNYSLLTIKDDAIYGSGFLDSTSCLLNYSNWQEPKNISEMISEIKILMANL